MTFPGILLSGKDDRLSAVAAHGEDVTRLVFFDANTGRHRMAVVDGEK